MIYSLILSLLLLGLTACETRKREDAPAAPAGGPTVQASWIQPDGGTGVTVGSATSAYKDDYFFVTGSFTEKVTFGSGAHKKTLSATPPAPGGTAVSDIFVVCYNSVGKLLWAEQAGGPGVDGGYGVATMPDGGCVVTGAFSDRATFGARTLKSGGGADVFLARYSSSGALLWAVQGTGPGNQIGQSVATFRSGSCVVTGGFVGKTFFKPSSSLTTTAPDAFVARFDASGNALWARGTGGSNTFTLGKGIAAFDADESCVVTGTFMGTTQLDSTTLTALGTEDLFVARLRANGAILWAKQAGGPVTSPSGTVTDDGRSVAMLPDGSCVITGNFGGTAMFGPITVTAVGPSDMFVARYSKVGVVMSVWPTGWPGTDRGRGIAGFGDSSFSVTGHFDTVAGTLPTNGGLDAFVARYRPSGTIRWIVAAGGTGRDQGNGVAPLGGNSVVTGYLVRPAAFSTGASMPAPVPPATGNDMFVTRLP